MKQHRFRLYPGDVRSASDGQQHYVNGSQLARLYGIEPEECVIVTGHPLEVVPDELIPLYPLPDGRYKEHLLQMKVADFQAYIRARKLYEHHSSGMSARRGTMRKLAAEKQARSIQWHEKHWPDFREAYERVT